MDRLLGSTTIVQTILTQVQLRSLSLLSLLLLATWSLSPLGSQASLRIIGSTVQSSNVTRPLQYINTSKTILDAEYAGQDIAVVWVPVNVLFGAAMLGSSSNSSPSVDSWGNMRIPRIEDLDSSTADAQGWYPVSQLNSSDDFASLVGLPLSEITQTANLTTSFSIETSYWTLSCPVFEQFSYGDNRTQEFQDPDPEAQALYRNTVVGQDLGQNLYLYSPQPYNFIDPWDPDGYPWYNFTRRITYMDSNNDVGWAAANCTIQTRYVEVSTSCSSGICTAVKIRNSLVPATLGSWTLFDSRSSDFYQFATHLATALDSGHPSVATPYQWFIMNPLNAFTPNSTDSPPITTVVSNVTFALRLGQLFNTYFMIMLAPNAITKGLQNTNLFADMAEAYSDSSLSNTTATEMRDALVLQCNTLWFVVLLLSSAVTALVGLCGLIAALCRLGPDIGFNVSSLVKDSPFVDQASVATTLNSTKRSVLMKDWYAKLGDVTAEDEVGYIAIGSGNVADLQRGRLYR